MPVQMLVVIRVSAGRPVTSLIGITWMYMVEATFFPNYPCFTQIFREKERTVRRKG